jgi:hypothetical protein
MKLNSRTSALRRIFLGLEELEPRRLLSGWEPTPQEQLFLERLNDARSNPAVYGQAIGLNLSNVAPSQPLAFDTRMIQADRLHSQDMSDRNYFSHDTPEGLTPSDRLSQAGVPWTTWGESIAGGFPTPESALAALIIDTGIPDLGHRRQLLSMDGIFQNQNQVGVGIVLNGSGLYRDYYTIDTVTTGDNRPFLTGVVYNDYNGNGAYDVGEGLGGITVTVAGVGSTTTFASGGYSFQVSPGTYTVTFSGGGLGWPLTKTVTVGSTNYRLNVIPSQFVGDSTPVEVVNDAYGRPEVFAIGMDDQVYAQKFDAYGNSASGYFPVGDGRVRAIATGHDSFGNPELFAINLNEAIYGLHLDGEGNPQGPYFPIFLGAVKSITVAYDGSGNPELFAIGEDDRVWAMHFDAYGNPVSGFGLTAWGQVHAISVVQDAAGNPLVFAVGQDFQVYEQWFDSYGDPVSGYALTAPGQVKSIRAGHDANNNPELFIVGLDDQVWVQFFDGAGNSQSGYVLSAHGRFQSITLGYDAYNRPEVFALDTAGRVWYQYFDGDGNPQGGFNLTSGATVKAITVGKDGQGNPELFAIGMDDQVWAELLDADGTPVSDFFLTQPGRVK